MRPSEAVPLPCRPCVRRRFMTNCAAHASTPMSHPPRPPRHGMVAPHDTAVWPRPPVRSRCAHPPGQARTSWHPSTVCPEKRISHLTPPSAVPLWGNRPQPFLTQCMTEPRRHRLPAAYRHLPAVPPPQHREPTVTALPGKVAEPRQRQHTDGPQRQRQKARFPRSMPMTTPGRSYPCKNGCGAAVHVDPDAWY